MVLDSLLSLQPRSALGPAGSSREELVATIAADLLEQVRARHMKADWLAVRSIYAS